MAQGSSKNSTVVILIIAILAALAVFFAYRKGYFQTGPKKVEVKVDVPVSPILPSPAPPPVPSGP